MSGGCYLPTSTIRGAHEQGTWRISFKISNLFHPSFSLRSSGCDNVVDCTSTSSLAGRSLSVVRGAQCQHWLIQVQYFVLFLRITLVFITLSSYSSVCLLKVVLLEWLCTQSCILAFQFFPRFSVEGNNGKFTSQSQSSTCILHFPECSLIVFYWLCFNHLLDPSGQFLRL